MSLVVESSVPTGDMRRRMTLETDIFNSTESTETSRTTASRKRKSSETSGTKKRARKKTAKKKDAEKKPQPLYLRVLVWLAYALLASARFGIALIQKSRSDRTTSPDEADFQENDVVALRIPTWMRESLI